MMMPSLPSCVDAYNRTPTFTETSVPQALLETHSTKAGVWGRIVVLSGRLRYELMESGEVFEHGPDDVAIIAPEAPHRVQPLGEAQFYVEFLR
jgi:tellurite resistance-related uncharacterized protein